MERKIVFPVLACILILGIGYSQDAFAITKTYVGLDNGAWETPTNWSPAGVPNQNDDVILDNTGFDVIISSAVTVGNSGSITFSPTTTNNNILVIAPGSLTIEGTVTMNDQNDDIIIINGGIMTVQCSGLVTLGDGRIKLSSFSDTTGTLVNHGTITGTKSPHTFINNNNIALISPAALLQNSGILPAAIWNMVGGTLETIDSICIIIGGEIIPLDQTALLLAGVQSVSMWMIPVVLSGIGIGVFVIKRRS